MTQKTVLVVDDSPTELRIITSALARYGYTVETAIDGEEALNKAVSIQPDLVLLDIILPKKNGYQVCRQLKTSPGTSHLNVVLVSSKSQDSDRYWGLKQGADNYLIKPFSDEELLGVVHQYI